MTPEQLQQTDHALQAASEQTRRAVKAAADAAADAADAAKTAADTPDYTEGIAAAVKAAADHQLLDEVALEALPAVIADPAKAFEALKLAYDRVGELTVQVKEHELALGGPAGDPAAAPTDTQVRRRKTAADDAFAADILGG